MELEEELPPEEPIVSELEAKMYKAEILQDFSAIARVIDMTSFAAVDSNQIQTFLIEQSKFTDFLSVVMDKISPAAINVVGIDFFLTFNESSEEVLGYKLDLIFVR